MNSLKCYCLIIISCLLISKHAAAIDSIEFSMGQMTFESLLSQPQNKNSFPKPKNELLEQLKLNQLSVIMDLTFKPVKFKIDLSKLKLPKPYKAIRSLNFTCQKFVFDLNNFECHRGKLFFNGLFEQKGTAADLSFVYNSENDILSLSVQNINLGHGSLSLNFNRVKNKWQSNFNLKNLEYKFLSGYIKSYFYQEKMNDFIAMLESAGGILSLTGRSGGILALSDTDKGKMNTLQLKGKVEHVHYQYGENLAEELKFNFDLSLNSISHNVQKIALVIDSLGGEVLQDDTYVAFNGNERLRTNFNLKQKNIIDISQLTLNSKGIFLFETQGQIAINNKLKIHHIDSKINVSNLSLFNKTYLANILSGTDYEALILEGELNAYFSSNLEQKKNTYKIDAHFKDFSLALNNQISLIDLNGSVFWNNDNQIKETIEPSQLSWQELTLNELPLGHSKFQFILHNDYLKLLKETDIPIFDGALHINSLEVSHLFSTQLYESQDPKSNKFKSETPDNSGINSLTLTIDGMIKPVSLALLSQHFEWPLLDGTLSAVIPSTTYNEKYLRIGGAMMLQVFDGTIIIKDLKVEEPLQDYAQLFANIDLINLNLKSLTNTYNFGEINGRVEGKLNALELDAWEPVAFDAYIRTPENDNSSHRISQRAIDNLSSLGGASGLLSRSFLSFFETFRYDKIGLSCRLKNNICHMSGVEAKGNSYYIVKGGGIPRIDVMGFQRKVNWGVLTSRLKAIQLANEAVIE